MADNNLTFRKSFSVENFKANQGADKIDIVKSPKTGKLFMAWTDKDGENRRGAVSAKGIPSKPEISEVVDQDGMVFFLLHEHQESANIVASF